MYHIKDKVHGLTWVIDKIYDVYFYFKVALFHTPSVFIFLIMICFGLYVGIKELFFKDKIDINKESLKIENKMDVKEKFDYKRLIFSFFFILLGIIFFIYSQKN